MVRLAELSDQVMVVTGASSGIGLVTAREAARRGAKVVLCARNGEALAGIAEELRGEGAEVEIVPGDVSRLEDVHAMADRAVDRWGRIDTWVNNAGVSIFGRLWQVPLEDQRRLFDINYWGVVHGSLVAVEHMSEAGGAIINVGSVLSDRAVPLQGAYSATKHAVKGFTDALRMELEEQAVPISVTLVKPSATATPYHEHARSYTEHEPRNPPPVYAPELAAREILRAAQKPVRDVTVGGGGKALATMGEWMPRLMDRVMERFMIDLQQTDVPTNGRRDNLYAAGIDGQTRGAYPEPILERSAFNAAQHHPVATGLVVLGAGLALAAVLRSRGS